MKSKIISQKKNAFLGREEFMLEIVKESAPTKAEIIEELGKDKNLTVINRINSSFGKNTFIADIFVYDSSASKDKYVIIPKKVRDQIEKEKKEEEKKQKAAKKAAEVKAKEEGN